MKTRLLIFITVALALTSCSPNSGETDFRKLNDRASKEYLEPVRPGTCGKNPFWNEFAVKFIYAPSFDFPEVEGAAGYRFTIENGGVRVEHAPRHYATLTEDPQAWFVPVEGEPTGESWTFTADSPKADLSPVWNKMPVAMMHLKVEGLDEKGNVLGLSGEKTFLRDFPFQGPYNQNVRPYRKAAVLAALFVHNQPAMQAWLTSEEPDMTYRHNTYACKIVGATISHECLLAGTVPELADEAIAIARNAAAFLLGVSQPSDAPLAYFPPTYYKNLISSARPENQGKMMTMEACPVGNAFLDLYGVTGEMCWLEHAENIAATYLTLQEEDGAFPIKLDYETGVPVNACKAMLTPIIEYFYRLENTVDNRELAQKYREARTKAEVWMDSNAMARFDMTGQFEDMTVLNQRPYQNLTGCASAPYASWLLHRENRTAEDLENARDLIRFSEDQFVSWDELPDSLGRTCLNAPSVVEQYGYRVPIDNSSAVVANAFLDLYEATGDRLCFEKAKALADNLTIVQNALDGQIPTSLDFRSGPKNRIRGYWVNCSLASEQLLLRMARLTE